MSTVRGRRTPRARSQPRRYRQRNVPRRWRRRLLPDPRHQRPRWHDSMWRRVRRVLWAWWLWAGGALLAAANGFYWLALACALLAVLLHLASPPERRPPVFGLDHIFDVASPEFLQSLEGATGVPFVGGNSVQLLDNGDAFYPAMLQAIRSATRSVTMEMYIFWPGDCGTAFAQALAERAHHGVPVKILLDAIGSATLGDRILKMLEDGGCHVGWYNPIHWYTLGRFNNRTHRKTLVVDGRVAFTGGAGIADQWRGNAQDPDRWRDLQVSIEGPAAAQLQTGFAQSWLKSTGELLSGEEFFPRLTSRGPVSVQALLGSPGGGASTIRMLYYLAIVCARRTIEIANPYFVPDEAARTLLAEAKRRGVRVRILVSGLRTDIWLARHNSVRLFGRLLGEGIEIYEYHRTMLHHKIMIVDRRWATVGTANFDSRSFAHNEESMVSFFEHDPIEQLAATFEEDVAQAERVTLAAWRNRGVAARLQEVVASMLQDQV
ncbi:MAG: cardiolipin synthase B [Luteitalea sp.]|nr:cardiolipin synthase B [Luteitalea sp.]